MRKITFRLAAGGTSPDANIQPTFPRQNADFHSSISQATSHTQQWIPSDPSHVISSTKPQQILQASQLSQPFQPDPQDKFILIIDDSQTVRKIVEACLHRENFKVWSFKDGIEAMGWLAKHQSYVPDLIMLDIVLPKLDGYEVARRLKAKPQFSNTVIVMLTSRDSVMERLKGRLAGAKGYLTKPFKTQELLTVIESHLGTSA